MASIGSDGPSMLAYEALERDDHRGAKAKPNVGKHTY